MKSSTFLPESGQDWTKCNEAVCYGGAGFIGSNFIHHVLERPGYEVINFDALTYAGNLKSLSDLAGNNRYRFVKGDITSADQVESALSLTRMPS